MMVRASLWTLAVMAACLIVSPAWAGWMVTYEDDHIDGGKKQSVDYYDGGHFRSDSGQGIVIYSGGVISMADTVARAYWQGTPEAWCRAQRKMMKEISAMIPAQFRDKPINQRKVTRKKLGTRKIAGFTATGYQFFVDGKPPTMGGEIWISSEGVLSKLARTERIGDCEMGDMSTDVNSSRLFRQTVRNAFVLKSPTGFAGDRKLWHTVISVKEVSVPASKFEMPSGYRKFTDYSQFMEYVKTHQQTRKSRPSRRAMTPPPAMHKAPPPAEHAESPPAREEAAPANENASGESKVPGMDELKKGVGKLLKSLW